MKIKLSQIRRSSRPIRISMDKEKLDELAESIKKMGLVVPIKVRPFKGGYEIVYGHRRAEAARKAGLTEIEAVVEGVDDARAYSQGYLENMIRQDLNPLEIERALIEIAKNEGVRSASELSRRGYGATTTLSRYWTLQYQPTSVRQLVAPHSRPGMGRVPLEAIDEVKAAGLTERVTRGGEGRSSPPKLVADVLTNTGAKVIEKAAKEGLSVQQTREVAEAVAAAPTTEVQKRLIETRYSPFLHDPAFVKERVKKGGPRDAILTGKTERAEIDWDRYPATKGVLDEIKRFDRRLEGSWRTSAEWGKFSPEAKRFIAERLRRMARKLVSWADELEMAGGKA